MELTAASLGSGGDAAGRLALYPQSSPGAGSGAEGSVVPGCMPNSSRPHWALYASSTLAVMAPLLPLLGLGPGGVGNVSVVASFGDDCGTSWGSERVSREAAADGGIVPPLMYNGQTAFAPFATCESVTCPLFDWAWAGQSFLDDSEEKAEARHQHVPWHRKKPLGVFRGTFKPLPNPRSRARLAAVQHPDLLDVEVSGMCGTAPGSDDTPGCAARHPYNPMPRRAMYHYKYLLDMDGWGPAFRSKFLFLSGSAVFKVSVGRGGGVAGERNGGGGRGLEWLGLGYAMLCGRRAIMARAHAAPASRPLSTCCSGEAREEGDGVPGVVRVRVRARAAAPAADARPPALFAAHHLLVAASAAEPSCTPLPIAPAQPCQPCLHKPPPFGARRISISSHAPRCTLALPYLPGPTCSKCASPRLAARRPGRQLEARVVQRGHAALGALRARLAQGPGGGSAAKDPVGT